MKVFFKFDMQQGDHSHSRWGTALDMTPNARDLRCQWNILCVGYERVGFALGMLVGSVNRITVTEWIKAQFLV